MTEQVDKRVGAVDLDALEEILPACTEPCERCSSSPRCGSCPECRVAAVVAELRAARAVVEFLRYESANEAGASPSELFRARAERVLRAHDAATKGEK